MSTNRRSFIKTGIAGLAFEAGINQVIQTLPTPIFPRLDCLSTGNYELDQALGGGIHKGGTIICGARQVGKTTFVNRIVELNKDKSIFKVPSKFSNADLPLHDRRYLVSYYRVMSNQKDYLFLEKDMYQTGFDMGFKPIGIAYQANTILQIHSPSKIQILKNINYPSNLDRIYSI